MRISLLYIHAKLQVILWATIFLIKKCNKNNASNIMGNNFVLKIFRVIFMYEVFLVLAIIALLEYIIRIL